MALLSAVLGGVILTMIEGAGLLFTRVMGNMVDPLAQMQAQAQQQESQFTPQSTSVGGGEELGGMGMGLEGTSQQQPASAGIPNYV